jgi:hypothetical protein
MDHGIARFENGVCGRTGLRGSGLLKVKGLLKYWLARLATGEA